MTTKYWLALMLLELCAVYWFAFWHGAYWDAAKRIDKLRLETAEISAEIKESGMPTKTVGQFVAIPVPEGATVSFGGQTIPISAAGVNTKYFDPSDPDVWRKLSEDWEE